MRLNFNISEFIIAPSYGLPIDIADKIVKHHLWPLNIVRWYLGHAVYVSQNSGYRPEQYELDQGRSGDSEHTFKGKGATDVTTNPGKLEELFDLLGDTEYTRICYYPGRMFFHCDYANERKRLYLDGDGWKQADYDQIVDAIDKDLVNI